MADGAELTTQEQVSAWARSMAKSRQASGGAIGEANAKARAAAALSASQAECQQWVNNTKKIRRVLKP